VCLVTGLLLPAIILAAAFFLLIDNFTYTVFRFGVRSFGGINRYVYAYLLLALIALSYRLLYQLKRFYLQPAPYRTVVLAAPGLLIVSVIFAFVTYSSSWHIPISIDRPILASKHRPNILIISADGLNAENMSVYGCHRDTTPYIRGRADLALVCENNFTNAGTSGASVASMFTGKLPTQTGLIYPPDILTGRDAYQHLPGVLRMYGYKNVDVSVRHHADPYDMNMRNSFDWANGREIRDNFASDRLSSLIGQGTSYFLRQMEDRIANRLFHAIGVREMGDPLEEVVKSRKQYRKDDRRINDLFSFIDGTSAPFFAHIHLLGTHGPEFHPKERVFSVGEKQEKGFMTDFYDDAILEFDSQVETIMRGLEKRMMHGNTVVVICTDHGQRWAVDVRLPLIFLFPGGKHSGRIRENVQNLDIGPTILDYLGMGRPEWMGGQSLISSKLDPLRLIFIVDRKRGLPELRTKRKAIEHKIGPPFYAMGIVGVIVCDKIFELNVDESTLTVSTIEGHTSPCGRDKIPSPEEIGRLIIGHLEENNYDTSVIETPLSVLRND
jgi:arylsulfatase A-like enzyme